MKFKNDGCGWRDMKVLAPKNERGDRISVCLEDGAGGFIGINDGKLYAHFPMTRKKMRAFANKILKELDR